MDKMTPQQRKDVFAAYVDGKALEELCADGTYRNCCGYPDFLHHQSVIRVKTEPMTRWFNIYDDGDGTTYETRKEADESAANDRIACIEIKYTKGEGL